MSGASDSIRRRADAAGLVLPAGTAAAAAELSDSPGWVSKCADTIRDRWRRARKAITVVGACAVLGVAVPGIGVVVEHRDAVQQAAVANRQADAAFEQAAATREQTAVDREQVEAANRQALCPDAMQARRSASRTRTALDGETRKLVAWCLEPVR